MEGDVSGHGGEPADLEDLHHPGGPACLQDILGLTPLQWGGGQVIEAGLGKCISNGRRIAQSDESRAWR